MMRTRIRIIRRKPLCCACMHCLLFLHLLCTASKYYTRRKKVCALKYEKDDMQFFFFAFFTYNFHLHLTENFRPFLLPCGHNLCEFCLSKHRQEMDFKCAVCNSSAPPTLNAKNPNSKYPSNIRDYYELDYHVLGEVNSLKYYQRYSVDAVNKSLHCTQMSDIVMDIKCCECGHNAAMGECKQCNAFYCKRCFDAVHHRKRVLETHVYVRLEDKKRPSKHFRVGKDIFRMPVPQHCNAHNMPANVYCQGCKTTGCLLCTTRYHPNHKTCPVGELVRTKLILLQKEEADIVIVSCS